MPRNPARTYGTPAGAVRVKVIGPGREQVTFTIHGYSLEQVEHTIERALNSKFGAPKEEEEEEHSSNKMRVRRGR